MRELSHLARGRPVPHKHRPWLAMQLQEQAPAVLAVKASSLNAMIVALVGLAVAISGQTAIGIAVALLGPVVVLLVALLVPAVGEQRLVRLAQRNGLEYRTSIQREADVRCSIWHLGSRYPRGIEPGWQCVA